MSQQHAILRCWWYVYVFVRGNDSAVFQVRNTGPETAAVWKTRHHIFIGICSFFSLQGPVLSINSYLKFTVSYIGHVISIVPKSILLVNVEYDRIDCYSEESLYLRRSLMCETVYHSSHSPINWNTSKWPPESRKRQEKKTTKLIMYPKIQCNFWTFHTSDNMMYYTFCQHYVSWKHVDTCKCELKPIW